MEALSVPPKGHGSSGGRHGALFMNRLTKIKSRLAGVKYRLAAPHPSREPRKAPPGRPLVAGFLGTPSGIGESARLCLAALTRLRHAPRALDLSPRFLPHERMEAPLEDDLDPAAPGPLILHVNPPELPAVCAHLGRGVIRDRLVVGYWAWELPDIPANWCRGFDYVHEVWVPSVFTAEAVAPHTDKPVRIVPHPVPVATASPSRADFGVKEDVFAVLAVCDLRSGIARKNPLGAVEAFRRAFGDDPNCLLILKVGGVVGNESVFRGLRRSIAGNNVMLITDVLPPATMEVLIASIDVLLSLHRSEGFGLMLAQAMRAGKVVIATDWSGSRDFLTSKNGAPVSAHLVAVEDQQCRYKGENQCWAEPDIEEASAQLRRFAEFPEMARILGEQARRDMDEFCSDTLYWSNTGEVFKRSVAV